MFRHLSDEYVIKLRQDCERYFWLAGNDQNYPNRIDFGIFDGTINRRFFTNGGLSVLGPGYTAADFPFTLNDVFDLANIYDNELWTNESFVTLLNPVDDVVVATAHNFDKIGSGLAQRSIFRFDTLLTTRISHIQEFRCGVEIYNARYFDPVDDAAEISFSTLDPTKKLCNKCANPTDTVLDNQITLNEAGITFRNEPHKIFPLTQTLNDVQEVGGTLTTYINGITIDELRKFFFITEPVTQETVDAARPSNRSPILWDDPDSIQPGLVLAPPPGGSFIAYGFLYTVDYVIGGSDTVIGFADPSPITADILIGNRLTEYTPDDFFRNEVYDTFVYDADRVDRLFSTEATL